MVSESEIRALIDAVRELNEELAKQRDNSTGAEEAMDGVAEAADRAESSLGGTSKRSIRLSSDLEGLARAALNTDQAFTYTKAGIIGLGSAASGLTELLGGVGAGFMKAFGLDGPGKAILGITQAISGAITKINSLTTEAMDAGAKIMQFFEGPITPLKELQAGLFDVEKQFGGTLEGAKQFADEMLRGIGQAGNDYFVSSNDIQAMQQAFNSNNISLQKLTGTVDTAIGSMQKLAFASLHASSVGLSMAKYADLSSNAMARQGKSFREASLQVQMFSDIAKETNMSINDIATSLNAGVRSFEKLGFAADFGRPMLEGFSSTLSDMGMGFEQALDLSERLTKSLAGLSTDYATAYITMQRGGIDMGGGGGILGAGIGIQNRILEAEASGDQAKIGEILAGGMRDTIASMTGGEIVTSFEAEEGGPQAQQQFFMQTKLLQQMYGLDEQTSLRTLNLLDQLGTAESTGNRDLVDSLNKQLSDEVEGRDETLTEAQKTNAQLSAINALNLVRNRLLYEQMSIGAIAGRRVATRAAETGISLANVEYEKAAGIGIDMMNASERLIGDMLSGFEGISGGGETGQTQAFIDNLIQQGFTPRPESRRTDDAELDALQREQRDRRRQDARELQDERIIKIQLELSPDARSLLTESPASAAQRTSVQGHTGRVAGVRYEP